MRATRDDLPVKTDEPRYPTQRQRANGAAKTSRYVAQYQPAQGKTHADRQRDHGMGYRPSSSRRIGCSVAHGGELERQGDQTYLDESQQNPPATG